MGRTRTAPAAHADPGRLRWGVVSCANLQAGWFSAYRHLAARDDLDLVLHLGDYLYEYAPGAYGEGQENTDVRRHVPAREIVSLADYRQRHAQYRTDPDLADLHARLPFVVTWDDHESTNDAWRGGAENHQPSEGDWRRRRARAHRAYDEWMPARMSATADLGDGTRLYRRLRFGRLAELSMLDLRTYRDQQVATPLVDGEVSDPDSTITGRQQLGWLKDSLHPSRGSRRRRAYVVVLDGCRPAEIDGELGLDLMPTVRRLRDRGRTFPRARALPVMETIPNHTMMMTGVRPDRSGVPANAVFDRGLGENRTLDRPSDLRVDTVLQRCRRQGLTSGTVLSKEYLYGIFGTRATHRWEPFPVVPVSEHAPDVFTMDATLAMVDAHDPDLVFVNLGDIDRVGHSDLTGTTLQAARRSALVSADAQVARLVAALQDGGRWRDAMLVVLADHSMDWSRPDRAVTLSPALEADPFHAGRVAVGQNGGADLVYWTGPDTDREQAVRRIRRVALATEGVLAAHDRRRAASWLRLGPEAGDVVVYARAGRRFSDPGPGSNPLPGNHGHPTTAPIPFFLSGGTRHPMEAAVSVTQQQAKDSYGGVKVGSAFLGFVTSIGMIVLLVAVLAALGLGLGGVGSMTESGSGEALEGTGGRADWYLGVTGVVVVLVVLFLAYLAGGYVAGRMARFHGVRQGLAVWGWAVLVAVGLTVAAAVLGGQETSTEELSPLAPGADELGLGAIGLAIVAAVTLIGAMLGGLAGMRFHRRVDRAESEPAPLTHERPEDHR